MTAVPNELSLGFTRCTLKSPDLSSYDESGLNECGAIRKSGPKIALSYTIHCFTFRGTSPLDSHSIVQAFERVCRSNRRIRRKKMNEFSQLGERHMFDERPRCNSNQ